MNIKQFIAPWLFLLTLVVSCEQSHLEDNLLESTVYFSRAGLRDVNFYDVEGKFNYSFYAVNAGYNKGTTTMNVRKDSEVLTKYNEENGASLIELPADCYQITLSNGTVTPERDTSRFSIQFDCEKLKLLSQNADYSDLDQYVVPLSLNGDGDIEINKTLNQLLIRPKMKQIAVVATKAGEVTVSKAEITGVLTFEFPVKTSIENKWETTFSIVKGNEAVDLINNSLLNRGSLRAYSSLKATPTEAYSVEFENTIQPGTSTSTIKLQIEAAKVPEGCSSIVVWLDGANILGEHVAVEGKQYMIVNLQNVPNINTSSLVSPSDVGADANYLGKYLAQFGYTILPRIGWTFSPDSYNANSYPNILDGNTASIWENRYNDATGSVGPKSTLPFNAIFDLGQPKIFNGIELWRRANATYVSDLRTFEIYVSDDKQNWKYITTIDYGTGKDQRAMYMFINQVSARYINLYVTQSNRSNSVSIAEFHLWNK
ncbi:BT_3987 domain-containing protein [Sphingobacterium faecale]|uniref:DUF1735 domain-containing protein n=1 Tax=Sphingobacterium faecale TaxID=2803775 RepID=A0ABS1R3L6_9SPHI|nr:DUF1735 domain-containing protein [Sphingobacterium faecale]MBL1409248.1 DUF1735 domain-containing protein [Sphingobacterium faecale]